MSTPLLTQLFEELPQPPVTDDPEDWVPRMHEALSAFRAKVQAHYSEGTLQRLLECPDTTTRQAAVLALGLCGSMASNRVLAERLHDPDEQVQLMASEALWEVWLRGNTDRQGRRLQRLIRRMDPDRVLPELDTLIADEPEFAEAINQRAIVHFQRGEFGRAIADCERVLQLNPYHFGAQVGMGQCYMKLRKRRAALRAFEAALQLNPTLNHLHDTIRILRREMGDE